MRTKTPTEPSIAIPQRHKAQLRAQLLAHADDHLTVRKSWIRYWPLVAMPFAAIALFALTTVWKPIQSPSSNPIVQHVVGPLTVQKVFAEAIKYIDKHQMLKPGEYYYTRQSLENTYNDKDSPDPGNSCIHTKIYQVIYTNDQGIMERMETYDKNDRLYIVDTVTPDGRGFGPKFFADPTIEKANEESVPCPPMIITPLADDGPVDIEEYNSSPEHRAFQDISSGIPARQKTALITLKSTGNYQLYEKYFIPDYSKPVTALVSGTGERRVEYYFDRATKAFIGVSGQERNRSIILHQDIRKLPANDPPEYSNPHPPQM